MVFQSLFLDAAGTLFELAEPVGVSYARIAQSHGLTLKPDIVEAAFRRAWKATPQPLHPEGHPPPDDDRSWWIAVVTATLESATGTSLTSQVVAPLFHDLYHHFQQASAWRLFPEVPSALEQLARIAPLHILSNFDRRLLPILHGLGIASFFQTVTLSSQAGASKPHPRIFQHALAKAGVPPHLALHIGDESQADRQGATQAGMFACLLDRPRFGLTRLAENLRSHDDSSLHAPSTGV
jgi:putative hydrolase of the HAD superfamily